MKAILIFIDGTICDAHPRYDLGIGTPEFYRREAILTDLAVPGSLQCLPELAQQYTLVYIGARPVATLPYTAEWLEKMGFPPGPIYLGETQADRLVLVRDLRKRFDFIAGIGDRWDDNELHAEIGCLSIIVQEHAGDWDSVPQRILKHRREQKIKENEVRLQGKVEGLVRVLPRLHAEYGDDLWEAHFESVMDMAETSREARSKEDLESFATHSLDPTDLRAAAKWIEVPVKKTGKAIPRSGCKISPSSRRPGSAWS
jgi:hypothetical protein